MIILHPIIKYLLPKVIPPEFLRQILIVNSEIHVHGSVRRTPQHQIGSHGIAHRALGRFQHGFVGFGDSGGKRPSRSRFITLGGGLEGEVDACFEFAVACFDVAGGIGLGFAWGGGEWKRGEQLLVRRHDVILRLVLRVHEPRLFRILLPVRPQIIPKINVFPLPRLHVGCDHRQPFYHRRDADAPRLILLLGLSQEDVVVDHFFVPPGAKEVFLYVLGRVVATRLDAFEPFLLAVVGVPSLLFRGFFAGSVREAILVAVRFDGFGFFGSSSSEVTYW
mmetsp:Transcript_578/g.1263  ORF Transcript_578/g.1263 Transcript_578/m.1263 type:complete len:278 (+) Transcript_578:550-1383(+)